MNGDGGYTKHYRRMWNHPAFRSKQEASVFSWMLDTAQWREHRMSTRFGPVTLGVGELLIAERELADDFGLHRNTLRALLQRMVDEGIIERFLDRSPHRSGTVVRIKNYAAYQGVAEQIENGQDRTETAEQNVSVPQGDRIGTKNKEGNSLTSNEVSERRSPGGKPPGGGRRKGPKQPGLALGNGAEQPEPADSSEPNPAKAIYVEGATLVSEMIGGDARWLIAKMLNAAGKDAARVLAVIREAHARHTAPGGCLDNPTAYLLWKAKPGSDTAAVPEFVNDWPVAETAAYCRTLAQVEKEHWPGLEGAIADVLAHGAHPDAHIYPVMEATISKNPNKIGVGLLVTSIRERMKAAPPVRDAA